MKNLLVANLNKKNKRKYNFEKIKTLINAQVENSVELGWSTKDIILVANFDYSFLGVSSTKFELNEDCFTGSKMFALQKLFSNGILIEHETIWAHDLDAWQNYEFDCPEIKDVGATYYSKPKFNGGSIFWTHKSVDIIDKIIDDITNLGSQKEEPIINKIFKSDEYKERITIINNTFNVGCSGFVPRYERSDKPVRVLHFHPTNRIAWETHALDRNEIGSVAIGRRLELLLRRYYPHLATKVVTKRKHDRHNRNSKTSKNT